MYRSLLPLVVAGLSVSFPARQATAAPASEAAVLSGGALMWKGFVNNNFNNNVLIVTAGDALISGAIVHIDGATWITKTEPGISNANAVFCTDVANGVQGVRKAYYVYYAAQTAGGFVSVISTTPPLVEGHPSLGLTFTYLTNTTTATTSAVFLGSYLTDSNSEIVPFRRVGSDIYFLWSGANTQIVASPTTIAVQFAGSANPVAVAYDLTNASFAWPKSATSAIVGLYSNSNVAASVLGILDPALLTVGANPKSWHPFFSWTAPNQNFLSVTPTPDRMRIPVSSTGGATIIDLTPAGSTENVALGLEGYVENVHHLF